MKLRPILVSLLVLSVASGILYFYKQGALFSSSSSEVHYHAAFHLYKDNVIKDFSTFEYMYLGSCGSLDEESKDPVDNVHLHDNNGEIVHVHAPGITWRTLFDSLGYSVSDTVITYVDGQLVSNVLDREIIEYEKVLFLEGENDDIETKLSNLPTEKDIVAAESISESCGS